MAFYGNFEGTLKTLVSIGKNLKVAIQNNSGVLEGRHNGGTFLPLIRRVTSHSANFTASHMGIHVCTNSISAQLPAPVLNSIITITKTSTNTITILRNGSENIHGVAASFVFSDEGQSITLTSNGTDWFII